VLRNITLAPLLLALVLVCPIRSRFLYTLQPHPGIPLLGHTQPSARHGLPHGYTEAIGHALRVIRAQIRVVLPHLLQSHPRIPLARRAQPPA